MRNKVGVILKQINLIRLQWEPGQFNWYCTGVAKWPLEAESRCQRHFIVGSCWARMERTLPLAFGHDKSWCPRRTPTEFLNLQDIQAAKYPLTVSINWPPVLKVLFYLFIFIVRITILNLTYLVCRGDFECWRSVQHPHSYRPFLSSFFFYY